MNRKALLTAFVALLCWTLPYLAGWLSAGDTHQFLGFLLNPIDGNSYLAKMQLGRMGDWRFTLPYTAHPGEGAYLFLFYIALGHLARLLSLPLIVVFHAARILAAMFMLWAIWRFLQIIFRQEAVLIPSAFMLVTFGSGMGWLFSPLLGVTSDFWVAEAYPFLSGYVNPHFPLGIGLIMLILIQTYQTMSWKLKLSLLLEGILLSIIMPFGIVVLAVILVGRIFWYGWHVKKWQVELAIWPLLAGGGFLLYQFIAIQTDPVLSQWNSQNITVSPPLWDYLVSFSPVLLLAVIGIIRLGKGDKPSEWRLVMGWMVLGTVLILIPFSLQRRFLLAYYIPLALLAVLYLGHLKPSRRKWIFPLLLILSIGSNGVVMMTGFLGIQTRNVQLFITRDEADGFAWLDKVATERSLVLSSPQTGNILPALTTLRVIYGHPFETTRAEDEKKFVEGVFQSENSEAIAIEQLIQRQVAYVFYGPREKEFGYPEFLKRLPVVYENKTVTVYQLNP